MTIKKLNELYGHGSNFYSGKDLGVNGADSGFSSYIGTKKFPLDYIEDFDEENDEDILDNRTHSLEKGYHLEETLENLNEGIVDYIGDKTYGLVYAALFKVLDIVTFEKAGIIGLLPSIATNLTQIYRANDEYSKIKQSALQTIKDTSIPKTAEAKKEKEIAKKKAIKSLRGIQKRIIRDFKDILQAIAIAIPAYANSADTVIAMAIEVGSDIVAKDVTKILDAVSKVMQATPLLKYLWNLLPLVGGKSILFTGFENIVEIDNIIDNKTLTVNKKGQEKSQTMQIAKNSNRQVPIRMGVEGGPPTTKEAEGKSFISSWFDQFKLNESSLENLSLETFIDEFDFIEDEEVDYIDEFSGGGAGGVATPLGTDASGKKPSKSKENKRIKDSNIWNESIRENQTWYHATSGKIILK